MFKLLPILACCLLASALWAAEAKRHPPNIELPPGEGRGLLEQACTRCHDLSGLKAYQAYWGRRH